MRYCDDYAALLDLYVDGELSPEEMSRVRDHLDRCPGCRAYVDDALAIRAAFPDVEDVEVPAGFAEGVMARIQTEAVSQTEAAPLTNTASKKKKPAPWAKVLLPLAACCAVVILLQNVPGLFSGRKEATASASAAMDTAAPAMTTESAVEEAGEVPVEEPAAAAERQITADSANGGTANVSPAEYAEPETEAEKAADSYTFTTSGTVYASILTLPSEGAGLMTAYTPVSESGTEVQYELTAEEAQALLAQLETASFSYQSEDGIDPTTDLVLVVLSK